MARQPSAIYYVRRRAKTKTVSIIIWVENAIAYWILFVFNQSNSRFSNACSYSSSAFPQQRYVLAQPEMEKRRFPLVKIPPLRGGDF